MITRGLSCDCVEFGHLEGADDPPDPPGYGPVCFVWANDMIFM